MRIFLDANILFSAAKSRGAIRELLERILDAGHECCADSFVTEEARRNLAAKAPEGIPVVTALLARMHVANVHLSPATFQTEPPLPEKDRPVLEGAIRHGCDTLLTGDRTHFGALYGKTVQGVTIRSPRSLAEILFR